MGQRIVGQQQPWWSGHGPFLAILTTGAALVALLAWGNWPDETAPAPSHPNQPANQPTTPHPTPVTGRVP